ncbi:5-demethoxyubiquinol-8 5-hydroxylase UbiM [Gluconobacter wancherniae]|uniref:5-demethoxyubiquinol-8 5-hydroxylase UbiM n=1 Tax=Gluconobacter wancherniae TaxID=1307955 RepID=UPI001B8D1B04|nr:5-demethoxyubiquinol-8 5-hydroxylase UbiM [Gluconobacter wancherniae]MBS1062059.1 5-demethoxyubiquinol-8 5-hydroxylase UbiM [Gluconobacter wancherniae]
MRYDAIIAGGGPVGLACAISLARDGRKVCVVERSSVDVLANPPFDGREIALTHHASNWLKGVGAWDQIPQASICPMHTARIETGAAGGAPLLFDAPATGPDALGHLVANHLIRRALYRVAATVPGLEIRAGQGIDTARHDARMAQVTLVDGSVLDADLLIAADGRFSRLRDAAGIGAIVHDFQRSILVCRMHHPAGHANTALQWFDEGQTIALLPIAPDGRDGASSSLVLTLENDEIARLKTLDEDAFNAEITARTHERMGQMTLESPRCVYPLKAVYAHRFHAPRFALIGDAAVGMHPITAHGFNLGLKGQETLARAIADGPGDAGAPSVLAHFARVHRVATAPLFAATNTIATVYTRDEAPFLAARKLGLALANRLLPFKSAVTDMLMDRHS